jgi:hypothetical protein
LIEPSPLVAVGVIARRFLDEAHRAQQAGGVWLARRAAETAAGGCVEDALSRIDACIAGDAVGPLVRHGDLERVRVVAGLEAAGNVDVERRLPDDAERLAVEFLLGEMRTSPRAR